MRSGCGPLSPMVWMTRAFACGVVEAIASAATIVAPVARTARWKVMRVKRVYHRARNACVRGISHGVRPRRLEPRRIRARPLRRRDDRPGRLVAVRQRHDRGDDPRHGRPRRRRRPLDDGRGDRESPDGDPALTLSPGRIDQESPAWTDSRKPLAGEVRFGGQPVLVIATTSTPRAATGT